MAAFFAAESADKADKDSREIAVWAINTEFAEGSGTDLKLLTCPQSELRYLHAQRGLFLYDKEANKHFVESANWRSFEQIVAQIEEYDNNSAIRKIVLPRSEVQPLLRLLWAEGITRAHLMPSYDNVAATLKTRWLA